MTLFSLFASIISLHVSATICPQAAALDTYGTIQLKHHARAPHCEDAKLGGKRAFAQSSAAIGSAPQQNLYPAMFVDGDDREKVPDETAASEFPFVGGWYVKAGSSAALRFTGNATAVHPRVVVLTSHQVVPPDAPQKSIYGKSGKLKDASNSTWVWLAGCEEPLRIDRLFEAGWLLGGEPSLASDYAVAITQESCLLPSDVAEPVSLDGLELSELRDLPVEMMSVVPAHSFRFPSADYTTFVGRDVFVYLKSAGRLMHRYTNEIETSKVLAHDLDADHGHSGSGVFLVDGAERKRFIGVLSGSLAGRDPVSLATPFTNSVAYAGPLKEAVEGAIAEIESER